MSDCEACVVRNRAICSVLAEDELRVLGKLGRKQMIERGQTLLWEGDDAPVVANVINGVLKLSLSTADGREQIVGVVFPADFMGRPFGKESPFTVTALVDSEVCVFNRMQFDRFAIEHPGLQQKLLERTLEELDRAREWLMLLGKKTASERIAALLIETCSRLNNRGCADFLPADDRFELPFDRQQMGDVLGLTIETVSRQLTKLKSSGVIELPDRRTVVIRNREALESLALAA